MLLDNNDYVHREYLEYTVNCFEEFLGVTVKLLSKKCSNNSAGMGAFALEYQYIPENYRIKFEYEKLYFDVHIQKNNGGDISLCEACQNIIDCQYGRKWSDWALGKENIEKAIQELAILLKSKSDLLYFYVYKDGKVYCDKDGKLTRLKDFSKRKVHLE